MDSKRGNQYTTTTLKNCPMRRHPERTRMYPMTGGILYSANQQPFSHIIIEGTENFIEFLERFDPSTDERIIIEASSCIGGCLNGPVMKKDTNILVRKNTLINYFKMLSDHAEKRINTSNYDLNLSKHFVDKNARIQVPEEQIREVLHLLGKMIRRRNSIVLDVATKLAMKKQEQSYLARQRKTCALHIL